MAILKRAFVSILLAGTFGALVAGCAKHEETTYSDSSVVTNPGSTTTTTDSMGGATPSMTMSDADIIGQLGHMDSMEVEAGKMAQSKAKSADIKQFAKMMVTDHTKMKQDGAKLAQAIGVTPNPPQVPPYDASHGDMQQMASQMESASGTQFDSLYISSQVIMHDEALSKLREFEAKAQNDQLKQLIQSGIPKVEQHLEKAREIQSKFSKNTPM